MRIAFALLLGDRALIGFPSNIVSSWGVEINDRFFGLRRINERVGWPDGPYSVEELHSPVEGQKWRWEIVR